jgi:hypothetical protein
MRTRERNLREPMTTTELLVAILHEALIIISDEDTSECAEEDV